MPAEDSAVLGDPAVAAHTASHGHYCFFCREVPDQMHDVEVAFRVLVQDCLKQFLFVDQISRIISPLFPSKFRLGSGGLLQYRQFKAGLQTGSEPGRYHLKEKFIYIRAFSGGLKPENLVFSGSFPVHRKTVSFRCFRFVTSLH